MSDSRTILYLNNFTGAVLGGGERHIMLLARAAREAGYRVIVACPTGSGLGDSLESEGFEVEALDINHLNIPGSYARLRRLVQKYQVELVHAHGFWPNNLSRLALGSSRTVHHRPILISTVHCQTDSSRLVRGGLRGKVVQWLRDRLDARTARVSDAIIAVSHDIASRLPTIGIPESSVDVIHNAIDVEAVKAAAKVGGPQGTYIGTIGHQEPVKGTRFLIEAFARLAGKYPDLKLAIIGDGSERARLEGQAEELGIIERVDFMGQVASAVPLLASLRIYALPSLSEGLNTTLLEALALRKPVVATDVGGNSEIILPGKTGLLVQPKDSEALYEALDRLLTDESLAHALGAAGHDLVTREFSAKRMCERTLALYARVQ